MNAVKSLTIWGWITLVLLLYLAAQIPIGNMVIRYSLILIIVLIILSNYTQLTATNG